jgi:hypothetical protein
VAEHERFKGKYHAGRHKTAVEAVNCHREYELDRLRFFDEKDLPNKPDTLHKCQAEGCEEYTVSFADIPPSRHWLLCSKHLNRKTVEVLFPLYTDGEAESFGSY